MKKITLTGLDQSLRSRITLDRKTNCWEWTGILQNSTHRGRKANSSQRPVLMVDNKPRSAARLVWETFEDETLPRQTVVANQCQNHKCVNPKHHRLSTYQDMMRAIRDKSPRIRKDPNLCIKGHDLTAPGAARITKDGLRVCKTCEFIRQTMNWTLPSERRSWK